MAKLVRTLNTDFSELLSRLESGILSSSLSASLEERCDWIGDHARCSVRVFERYSAFGGNRLSLTLTLFQETGGPVSLCAIAAGGSQAVFFKINTISEQSFLSELERLL